MAASGIVATPGTCGGRPRIAGSRIRVQDVAGWYESEGMSPDEIVAAYPHLSLADVHAALAYYYEHLDEIRRDLADDETLVAEMKAADIAHEPSAGRGDPDPSSSR
jgi:uncharacterized protein (DUF433 family)